MSAHSLGNRPPAQHTDNKKVIIKLFNHSRKSDLVQSCWKSKPAGVFLSDNLTPYKSNLLYALRMSEKMYPDRIGGCGPNFGRLFAWIKPLNLNGRIQELHMFICFSVFGKFCMDELNINTAVLVTHKNN